MTQTPAATSREGIVIVGGSVGGLRTAERLRRLGYAAPITILEASGDLPYDRTALSKKILEVDGDQDSVDLRTRDEIERLDVDLRLHHRASRLDTAAQVVHTAGGEQFAYSELVIATGSEARTLAGAPPGSVCYLRSRADAVQLRERMAAARTATVVGGGFIGSEVAVALARRGIDVTLVEPVGHPLSRVLGDEVGARLAELHARHGVRLLPGRAVLSVLSVHDSGHSGSLVELDDGTTLQCDLVVGGVGASPNTGWLDGSGVSAADGVLCDEYCRTSVAHVYAVGDVARWPNALFGETMRVEHWTNAVEQAATVGWNIVNPHRPKPFAPVPYVWSDQYGLRLQILGRPRPDDELTLAEDDPERGVLVALYRRDDSLSGVFTINAPEQTLRLRRVLADRLSFRRALEVVA